MLDTDGNGKLSLDEFQSWFLKNYFGGDGDDEDDKIGIKLRRLAQNGKKRLATDIFRASWEGNLNVVKSFASVSLLQDKSSTEKVGLTSTHARHSVSSTSSVTLDEKSSFLDPERSSRIPSAASGASSDFSSAPLCDCATS